MIYFASFFEPQNHWGEVVGLSLSLPNGFYCYSEPALMPSWDLLNRWKQGMSEQEYTEQYRAVLKGKWILVQRWFNKIDRLGTQTDQTYCCWEPTGEFCHRNLVATMVRHYRPHLFGGCDVPNPSYQPVSDRQLLILEH